MLAKSYRIT